ncbi:MAG TPA: hypothetical protein VJU78_15485 [Chitinophagaceae bacterium]|nr:hypothetical protein [Chitinophagaceae bacterium]
MKWVYRKGNLGGIPPDERHHFEEIELQYDDCEDGLEAELRSKGYSVWETHQLNKHFQKKAQRKYEAFVGGFLSFYERDHEARKIFFEWCDKGQKNYVRIFIDGLASLLPNPPDPPGPPPPESSE